MSKRYEWVNGETYCDSDQMYDNETGNKTQPVYVIVLGVVAMTVIITNRG